MATFGTALMQVLQGDPSKSARDPSCLHLDDHALAAHTPFAVLAPFILSFQKKLCHVFIYGESDGNIWNGFDERCRETPPECERSLVSYDCDNRYPNPSENMLLLR
eukprot:CAMPEP_0184370054 /NCGR_PEP_ID=MMETSP1089-20130417/162603_1 /TAXON_ID=38269 ORGANISM="Gloeochaete wittrockiana, Strain SAG46.84" /NCGR_SAMPLE_ID=MMETSP1089 /ASSEMBLY_ACC=CAM_ASM_000445 /LENGTH=105 /DNA_ID=CAMNT_0026712599 /DNA_START=452 /DNA_END=769 /DNA_ORIENTATION=+